MRRIIVAAALVAIAGCAAEPPTAPAVVVAPLVISGNNQFGAPGYLLAESLAVRVVNANGEPVSGVSVTWEAPATNGTVVPGAPVTDADGIVRAAWRLPTGEGQHWATARVGTLPAASFASTSQSAVLTAVAGNSAALCGIESNGSIRCWRPPVLDSIAHSEALPTADRFVTLAFGGDRWCAVTGTGRIACFSAADLNRTGRFAPEQAAPAILTSFGPRLVQLAAARSGDAPPVFCGVTGDGEAWCWGSNAFGQLGIGTKGEVAELPVRVAGAETYVAIDVSEQSVCAITSAGAPYCWGSNSTSLIGNAAIGTEALIPTAVVTPHRFFALAVTLPGTACGIRSTGQAVCWGRAARDALGRPGVMADDPEPKPVVSDNIFISIARNGAGFSVASIDRELVIWGALPNSTSSEGPGFTTPTRIIFDERFPGTLRGGTDGYACMKSLFGGARCIDLYVYGPVALRTTNTPSRPAQFGVPVR